MQRPIPVWLGAGSSASPLPPDPVLNRIATISDGWFPTFPRTVRGGRQLPSCESTSGRRAGPDGGGIEGRIRIDDKQPEDWVDEARGWRELGAASITVEARRGGLEGVEQHIDAIVRFRDALGGMGDW